jgi:hypothetical protein
VLDQSDTDSERGSVRHLTHEDLEAYANGRLAAARSSSCQTHLDSCQACRAELEDLRAFQGELANFSRAEVNAREFARSKRRRKLSLPLAASSAVMIVAAASAVLWFKHERPRAVKVSVATSVAQASIAPPTSVSRPPIAPVTTVAQRPITPAASSAQVNGTTVAVAPHQTQPVAIRSTAPDTKRAPEPANKGFALLGPNGEITSERRPEFSWQPLPGAIRYSVAIVDARLHPVQRSPALRTTVWRPRRPLRRGRTYLWQVTATLRGGSKVVAAAPGTLTESAEELSKAPPADSGHGAGRTLL